MGRKLKQLAKVYLNQVYLPSFSIKNLNRCWFRSKAFFPKHSLPSGIENFRDDVIDHLQQLAKRTILLNFSSRSPQVSTIRAKPRNKMREIPKRVKRRRQNRNRLPTRIMIKLRKWKQKLEVKSVQKNERRNRKIYDEIMNNDTLSFKAVNILKYDNRCRSKKVHSYREKIESIHLYKKYMKLKYPKKMVMPKKHAASWILSKSFFIGYSDLEIDQCNRTLPIKCHRFKKNMKAERIAATYSFKSWISGSAEPNELHNFQFHLSHLTKHNRKLTGSRDGTGNFSRTANFQRTSGYLSNVLNVYWTKIAPTLKIEEKSQEELASISDEDSESVIPKTGKKLKQKGARKPGKCSKRKQKISAKQKTCSEMKVKNNYPTDQDVIGKQEDVVEPQSHNCKYTNNLIMFAIRSNWRLTKSEEYRVRYILYREERKIFKLSERPYFKIELHPRNYLKINCSNSYSCLWLYNVHSQVPQLYDKFHIITENDLHVLIN